jgi:hypothetical protein
VAYTKPRKQGFLRGYFYLQSMNTLSCQDQSKEGIYSLNTELERLEVYQEAMFLVKDEGKSDRQAEAILTYRHGRRVISFQTINRKSQVYDGTLASLADRRGERCGRSPQFWLDNEPFRLIYGHKASGCGSLAQGHGWIHKNRQQLGFAEAAIPSMNQIYYAVQQTADFHTPEFNRQLGDQFEEARVSAVVAKYQPNDRLAGDEIHLNKELGRDIRSAQTGQTMDAYIFLAVDVATGVFRKPTEAMVSFDEQSFIAALSNAHKSCPELGLHYPCAPVETRLDHATFHKTLSVFQSEQTFQAALIANAGKDLSFRIRFSTKRVPKTNPHAERHNGIVRQMFLRPFLTWFEVRCRLKPEEPVYFEVLMKMLMQFLAEHNASRKTGHEFSRIQEYNMGSTDERTRFPDSLIDDSFKYYHKGKLESTGVEIDSETHLNAEKLDEYRGKQVIVAINPFKVGLNNPVYFKSSKYARLRHIGNLVHEEADPTLRGTVYRSRVEAHNRAATADVVLAAKYVERRSPQFEAAYSDYLGDRGERKIKDDVAKQEVVKARAKTAAEALQRKDSTPVPAPEPSGWNTTEEES